MRLIRFSANSVHGYLPFNFVFKHSLTFLTGLNGCGKTTAINLITALLTPSVQWLIETPFEYAELEVELDGGNVRRIRSEKANGRFMLSLSGVAEPLYVETGRLDSVRDDPEATRELLKSFEREALSSPVHQSIQQLPSPMVLGIDRRMRLDDEGARSESERGHRMLLQRRAIRLSSLGSLEDVQMLVRDAMLEIRERQAQLDDELRKRIILDAFSYTPTVVPDLRDPPSRATIQSFKQKLELIAKSTPALGVPVADLQDRLTTFLERMEGLTDVVATSLANNRPRKPKAVRAAKKKSPVDATEAMQLAEWVFNASKIDGILELMKLIEENAQNRDIANRPITSFLALVNRFLSQTGKTLVAGQQLLAISVDGQAPRPLGSISSGERQIIVMLAHLSFNKRVAQGGIFIVDEPELSLHLAWQEMFVDAILEASPNLQLVLATHSPAIILTRDENCVDLSREQPC